MMKTENNKRFTEIVAAVVTATGLTVGVTLWFDGKFQDHEIHLTESEARLIQRIEEDHLALVDRLDDSEELLITRMLQVAALSTSSDASERLKALDEILSSLSTTPD